MTITKSSIEKKFLSFKLRKNFPQNVDALRILPIENYFTADVNNFNEFFKHKARKCL